MKIELKILNKEFYRLDYNIKAPYEQYLPSYATPGSAAIDLVCTEDVIIYPGETKLIPTGLAIWIGSGQHNALSPFDVWGPVAGLILPRSGLGTKGLILANTIGLIDEDYQGELMVSAWNRVDVGGGFNYPDVIELKAGDRFAQLMFIPVIKAQFEVVEEFSDVTDRTGGFGSTGK